MSAILVAGVAALLVLAPALDRVTAPSFRGIDWRFYELAAQRFLAGEALFTPTQLAGPYVLADLAPNAYLYAPPTILFLIPFVPFGPVLWAAFNVTVFVTGIAAMARRDIGRHWVIGAVVALSIIAVGQPYIEAVVVGNVNLALAGVFAWAWATRGRVGTSGALAGVGGLVKLHPIALIALNPRESAPRALAAAIAVIIGAAVLTLPILGMHTWIDYVTAFTNVTPLCGPGSLSATCALTDVAGPAGRYLALAIAACLVLAAFLVRNELVAFSLIVGAVFVPQPEVFPHTFLFVEVLLFAVVCFAFQRIVIRQATPRFASDSASA